MGRVDAANRTQQVVATCARGACQLGDGRRWPGDLTRVLAKKRFFSRLRSHMGARAAIKFTHSCWSTVYALINTTPGVSPPKVMNLVGPPQADQRKPTPQWAFSLLDILPDTG